jgi:diacylglycerol kinase (ATP)
MTANDQATKDQTPAAIPTSDSPVEKLAPVKKLHVVMNPVSGQNPMVPEKLQEMLELTGLQYKLYITRGDGDAERYAKEAVEAGADVVAAYGGDGTVMSVGTALMGSGVPLAILPAGTANVMSVELKVPQDLEGALLLATGENAAIRTIDIGKLNNDHCFLLRVGIGLEAETTINTPREEKKKLGRLAYFKSAIGAFFNASRVRYRVTIDGETHYITGVTCVICNSAAIGVADFAFAPEISVSDGFLDVVVLRGRDPRSLGSLVRSVLRSVRQEAKEDESIPHWKGKEVSIRASRKQGIGLDGEKMEIGYPVEATIVPNAIKVLVPIPPEEEGQVEPPVKPE